MLDIFPKFNWLIYFGSALSVTLLVYLWWKRSKIKMKRMSKRTITILVVALLLAGLFGGFFLGTERGRQILRPRGISELVQRSVSLNNYNNWQFLTKPTDDTLANKLATVSKFQELTYTESWDVKSVTTQAIKSLNPAIKLYRLYTLNVKPTWDSDWSNPQDLSHLQFPLTKAQIDSNDWWMKDGNGNIVKENDNVWFVDVGKPGVKEAFLQSVLDRNQNKGFDGVVFDYWWPSMVSHWITSKGLPPSIDYPNDDTWFTLAWQPFIDYAMKGLHNNGYTIIGNCAGEYGTSNSKLQFQRSLIDGTIYEQGSLDWDSNWLSGSTIASLIDSLSKDNLQAWVATSGLKDTDPLFEQKKLVDLATYYIGLPLDPSLQQKRAYHYYKDGNIFWDPLWDFDIGVPKADREQVYVSNIKKYAWSRKFTEGLVLLNYGASESQESITFELNPDLEYQDSQGRRYEQNVNLPPHTALILHAGRKTRSDVSSPSLSPTPKAGTTSIPTSTPTPKTFATPQISPEPPADYPNLEEELMARESSPQISPTPIELESPSDTPTASMVSPTSPEIIGPQESLQPSPGPQETKSSKGPSKILIIISVILFALVMIFYLYLRLKKRLR